jgi:hypothetical protein
MPLPPVIVPKLITLAEPAANIPSPTLLAEITPPILFVTVAFVPVATPKRFPTILPELVTLAVADAATPQLAIPVTAAPVPTITVPDERKMPLLVPVTKALAFTVTVALVSAPVP